MPLNFLEKSIIATLCYYDIFDYPLTGLEVFKFLINPLYVVGQIDNIYQIELEPIKDISLGGVLEALEGEKIKKLVSQKNGFYFLKGRNNLVKQRIERQKIAAERWKKVVRVLKFIQGVPFVKMIAVCNSLAIDNSKEEADIDFFIIVRRKRIWLARFLITFLVWLMGEWRHKQKISNRICLSFYVSEEFLSLKSISIKPYDIYLANWIYQLQPVFCQEKIYEDFILANQWVKDYLLNFGLLKNHHYPAFKQSGFFALLKKFLEKILSRFLGDIKETILRFFQKIKISHSLIPHKIPTAVIISDQVLKFHENDKREYFQEEFLKRLKNQLSIDNN